MSSDLKKVSRDLLEDFVRFEVFTAVTVKNYVFWFLQEPHGVTSEKTPFFT
jgi:hypothetical protein